MSASDTIKKDLSYWVATFRAALASAVCSMPSRPVSDAAHRFTAHWCLVTVTKRADPSSAHPGGEARGVRRVTREGWAGQMLPHERQHCSLRSQQRPVVTFSLQGPLATAEPSDRTGSSLCPRDLPHESGSSQPEVARRPPHPNPWRPCSSLPRVNPPEQLRQQAREARSRTRAWPRKTGSTQFPERHFRQAQARCG